MLLAQNLQFVKKRYPELAERIEKEPLTGRYKVMKSQSKGGFFTLIDTKTNRNYYNSIDPVLFAEQDIHNRKINLGAAALFLGFGLGYQPLKYLTKYNSAIVLVIEKEIEILKVAMMHVNLTDLFKYPNFHLIAGVDLPKMYPPMYAFLRIDNMMPYLQAINIIENATSLANEKEYYLGTVRVLRDGVRGVLETYGNDPYDSLIGIKYILKNLSTIIENPGIEDLKDAFKGKPGVVVATGPSLNKNIHLLEGIYNKAVIAGADASAKVLKKKGLKPAHLVSSLERVIETSYLFEGLTEEDTKDSYLAACPVILPETYANFPGEKLIVYRDFATFKWLDIPKGQLEIGPSSGNMAFKTLEYLGCDPIILIGQDLAYADDLRSHAEGTHFGEEADTKRFKHIKMPGNYTDEVTSTPVWRTFLKHYERDVSMYKGTVINATEGGAKIIGTELMTFQEAIDKYISDDVNAVDVIKKTLKAPSKQVKKSQFVSTNEKLEHAINYSQSVIDKFSTGLDLCIEYEQIMGKCGGEPDEEATKRIDEISTEVSKILQSVVDKDFYLILMHYVQAYLINAILKINAVRFKLEPSKERDGMLIVYYKEVFSVVKQLIVKILDEFVQSKEILENYIKEHKIV